MNDELLTYPASSLKPMEPHPLIVETLCGGHWEGREALMNWYTRKMDLLHALLGCSLFGIGMGSSISGDVGGGYELPPCGLEGETKLDSTNHV